MTADTSDLPDGWRSIPVRHLSQNLDYLRIPKNSAERSEMVGDIPYWGANSVQGYVNRALVSGPIVLVGEDGAPFFDPLASVAFAVDEPIWPNNHVHVLRPFPDVDFRFLAASLNAVDYSLYVKGSTRDKLNQSELSGITLAVPRLREQRRIADFLERETAEIDAFIADQEELIGLLAERRAATVSHAVTKGLDPSVPMKDSGVGWLGRVPADWQVVPAKVVLRERKSRSRPDDVHLTPSQAHGVLPQTEYMARTGKMVVLNLTGADQMRHVEPNDFISHLRSFQGGLELSRLVGKVSAAYTVLQPLADAHPEFFRYLFKSTLYVQALQTTTDQLRDGQSIRFGQVALLPLPLPDGPTQRAVAQHLDRETAEIDAAIADAREAIALSRERRAALISAAVTGKIDVREAA